MRRNAQDIPNEFLRLNRRIDDLESTLRGITTQNLLPAPPFSRVAWDYSTADLTLTTTPTALTGLSIPIVTEKTIPYVAIAFFDFYSTVAGATFDLGEIRRNATAVDGTGGQATWYANVLGRVTAGTHFMGTMPRGTNTFTLYAYKNANVGTSQALTPHSRLLIFY